jgi:hypothetical protein
VAVVECDVAVLERHAAREQLEERDAERVQVGAVIDLLAALCSGAM